MSAAEESGVVHPAVREAEPRRIWFGRSGCVEKRDDGSFAVYIRGEVIGVFDGDDVASRDVLIAVAFQDSERERKGIAKAFRVSLATVKRVGTRFKVGGFRKVADTGRSPGAPTVRTEKLKQRLSKLFEQGFGPRRAHRAVAKLASYGTVQSMHAKWLAERAASRVSETVGTLQQAGSHTLAVTGEVTGAASTTAAERGPFATPATEPAPGPYVDSSLVPSSDEGGAVAGGAPRPGSCELPLAEVAPPRPGIVQHIGSWTLLALMNALGVYDLAARVRGAAEIPLKSLRVALDASIIALAIGEDCVEGVRRLETPSVGTLLRNGGGVSACWVRSILHAFADAGSSLFQATVASRLLRRAAEEGDPRMWLYIDNHMRPYTGQHVIRHGWRMQDKHAVPGTTDYYLHDRSGAPILRMSDPAHGSLCEWLMPAVEFVHKVFDKQVKPVLAFDRGGAFPEAMAELRDGDAEFVTYERKPYPELGATEFKETLEITLASRPAQPTVFRYVEAPRKNLGKARGRVRRISLLTEDGQQVNILGISELPAEDLIRGQLARWGVQENQLKHGVERWGINHLDGRTVEEYPPDDIIPNPERRRLERELKLSCTAEGHARNKLARLNEKDPDRRQHEETIEAALARQRELEALRAEVPTHAPVSETPLAGRLKRHELGYKNVLDTVRTALANIESELAVMLAPHLRRPREAKKALANLFAAPGKLHVSSQRVMVRLMPAATSDERTAFTALLDDLSRLKLALPGDPDRRRLLWRLT